MNIELLELSGRVWLAIALGGIANYMLGALWYMALFQKPWVAATGRSLEEFRGKSPGASLVLTLIGAWLSTAVLVWFYQAAGGSSVVDGVLLGAFIGIGVAAMEGVKKAVYNFDDRTKPWQLFAVDGGYAIAGLMIAGVVVGIIL
ncbi:DUF1761 domain-containing protein [Salinispirillum marinum]|uniref:DUF1761 domain-containing protein n=2 Tax=Saccharospirillaceae TaxID=255527 RepID=A0ABV8BHN5_9GAMM